MRIDSSGNVGIGETSPDTALDVVGGSADSVVNTLTLKNDSTGNSAGTAINFVVDGVNDVVSSQIIAQRTGAAYHQGSLQFVTRDSGGGGLLERMRINQAGNVGIGTTSPTQALEVVGQIKASNHLFSSADVYAGGNTFIFGNSISNGDYLQFETDKVKIYSGGTAGLTVKDGGNVGIGTDSPSEKLHVNSGTTDKVAIFESSDTTATIELKDPTASSQILNSVGMLILKADPSNASGSTRIGFETDGSERMRIDNSGNVLVGKTAANIGTNGIQLLPNSFTSFTRTNDSPMYLVRAGSGGSILEFSIGGGGTDSAIGTTGSDDMTFYTGAAATDERMRLTTTGLGIGTTSPAEHLHIKDATYNDSTTVRIEGLTSSGGDPVGQLEFYNTTSAPSAEVAGFIKLDSASGGRRQYEMSFGTGNNGAATTQMLLDKNGQLGIGTDSPSFKLHVSHGDQDGLRFTAPNTGETFIDFGDTDDNDIGRISYDHADNHMALRTNNSERMRIDSSGRVGIGTTNPSHKLDIVGGGLEITQEETTDAIALLDSNNSNAKYLSIQGDSGDCNIDNSSGRIILQRNGVNRLLCTTSGVDINGALSKDSGSFKIDHPLKPETHHLVHSFIEGPQADNLYSGEVELINGQAQINLDEWFGMTEGTLVALNRDFRVFTTNESDWDNVKGSIENNILTIICQNPDSNATVSWLVIGERQDKEIHESILTDDNGKIIVEPQKVTEE
jgi:hypothetical protein